MIKKEKEMKKRREMKKKGMMTLRETVYLFLAALIIFLILPIISGTIHTILARDKTTGESIDNLVSVISGLNNGSNATTSFLLSPKTALVIFNRNKGVLGKFVYPLWFDKNINMPHPNDATCGLNDVCACVCFTKGGCKIVSDCRVITNKDINGVYAVNTKVSIPGIDIYNNGDGVDVYVDGEKKALYYFFISSTKKANIEVELKRKGDVVLAKFVSARRG